LDLIHNTPDFFHLEWSLHLSVIAQMCIPREIGMHPRFWKWRLNMDDFVPTNEGRSRLDLPGGLSLRGIAAIAAVALSIVGLCGVAPVLLMAIAAIFLGMAFLFSVGNFVSRYADFTPGVEAGGGGLAFDALAGLAGIVLGILALIGVSPGVLLPSTAIAFGCAMLLESASFGPSQNAMFPADGMNLLSGAAAIVLGILALSGYSPAVLTFVAFLTVGCVNLLSSTSLFQKTSAAINRRF
jgi:hypothetical protein